MTDKQGSDTRADIYGLGCLLYELCALRWRWNETSQSTYGITSRKFSSEPRKQRVALQQIRSNIRPKLCELQLKILAVKVRYAYFRGVNY